MDFHKCKPIEDINRTSTRRLCGRQSCLAFNRALEFEIDDAKLPVMINVISILGSRPREPHLKRSSIHYDMKKSANIVFVMCKMSQ